MHVIAGEKMNTYRIAVCDDDPVMREQLHSFCRELLDGESIPYAITAFPSAAELEKRMNSDVEKPFNLLILDIQMNGMTGLELAQFSAKQGRPYFNYICDRMRQLSFRGL